MLRVRVIFSGKLVINIKTSSEKKMSALDSGLQKTTNAFEGQFKINKILIEVVQLLRTWMLLRPLPD